MFSKLDSDYSNIKFANNITEGPVRNYLNNYYFYNGSGVAVGDINNDGLVDIYFGANQGSNKLYLNKGELIFQDITNSAGVGCFESWTTGVTMVDINNDGFLDIYVCNSGHEPNIEKRRNRLFINNGDLTFTESALTYGLASDAFSTQAYFFDYDQDNQVDMYLVNHRIDWSNNNKLSRIYDMDIERETTDHLFRNNGNNTFTDVTEESGVLNKTWGLSASIGDFNNDGWEDIYLANDFVQGDILYINNQNGTFTDKINDHFTHTSRSSMGSDIADINNDGLLDLIVLDMVPDNHVRLNKLMLHMDIVNFVRLTNFYNQYQYLSNTLQINNGKGLFSEVGQLAGIHKTDWSWAPLFADFDNDGFKDLFVTNGIKRDVTDNDYYVQMDKLMTSSQPLRYNIVLDAMPSVKLQNYIFRNNGDFTFENKIEEWGLTDPVNSNGAAYADLDNDGDLDLVINNLDETATIYINNNRNGNYLKIKLKGPEGNFIGIGTKIYLQLDNQDIFYQHYLSRGYLSSVAEVINLGLGADSIINNLTIIWPDQKKSLFENIKSNQTILVNYIDSEYLSIERPESSSLFTVVNPKDIGITFTHKERRFNDFRLEKLLPHRQSRNGPYISKADVNGDKLEDFFIGGAAGQAGELYLQQVNGNFIKSNQSLFEADSDHEDMQSLFFDFDNDDDPDLYLVSGSNEFPDGDPLYRDRLYINDGSGNFEKSIDILPNVKTSGQSVAFCDIDNDGDLDLFVGGHIIPGKYPLSPSSYILLNDDGRFTDVTDSIAPSILDLGMVSDAVFHDMDDDGDSDLIVVGEWMPISIFINDQGFFTNKTEEYGLSDTHGWWFTVSIMDVNDDGTPDILAGNIGSNNKYQPTSNNPLHIYAGDLDNNGTFDIVMSYETDGKIVPIRGRTSLSNQIPFINKKYLTFEEFAYADVKDMFGEKNLSSVSHYKAEIFQSCVFLNHIGSFSVEKMTNRAQFGPIRSFLLKDFNNDGFDDIMAAGNLFGTDVETIRYDVPNAVILSGKDKFKPISTSDHGIYLVGDIRDMEIIERGKDQLIIITRNNDSIMIYTNRIDQ